MEVTIINTKDIHKVRIENNSNELSVIGVNTHNEYLIHSKIKGFCPDKELPQISNLVLQTINERQFVNVTNLKQALLDKLTNIIKKENEYNKRND